MPGGLTALDIRLSAGTIAAEELTALGSGLWAGAEGENTWPGVWGMVTAVGVLGMFVYGYFIAIFNFFGRPGAVYMVR